jgi:segregation and condensation protein B
MDGNWAFRTSADLSDALSMKKDVQRKLSKAAMETLAIVSYHQPVTRPEIENIRGVAISNGTLDVLMECGWVKPGRRRESPGRPLTWVTTPAFLDHFGLTTLNDLPGMDELKSSGLLDARPAIDVTTGSLFGAEDEMLAEDLNDSDFDDEEDDDAYDASVEEGETVVSSEENTEDDETEEVSDDEESDELDEEDSDADDSDDDEDEDEGEAWDDLDASNDDDNEESDDDEEVA